MIGKTHKFRRFTDFANHQDKEELEGSSCHFLYCDYIITPLCEPRMNFREVFQIFLEKNLKRLSSVSCIMTGEPPAKRQKN